MPPLLRCKVRMTESDCPEAWTNRTLVLDKVHGPPGDDNICPPPPSESSGPPFLWCGALQRTTDTAAVPLLLLMFAKYEIRPYRTTNSAARPLDAYAGITYLSSYHAHQAILVPSKRAHQHASRSRTAVFVHALS